jgi:glycosyltransferase involved in cell wall biosynthesis
MRILFLSAFYPPFVIGGWEQLVQDINNNLKARGHITHVLTSIHGINKPVRENGIDRLLTLEGDIYHYKPFQFLSHGRKLKKNLKHTEAAIRTFNPDIVFIHVMWNLSKGVAWMAEKLCPGRVVYYIANDWPYASDLHSVFWHDHARNRILDEAKHLLSPIPLKIIDWENHKYILEFRYVMCVSQAIRDNLTSQAKIDKSRIQVVYNGVEGDMFVPPDRFGESGRERHLSLLYAGSLVHHKGVHTAIEAISFLSQSINAPAVTLSIIGSGHPDYEMHLKKLVSDNNLHEKVHFLPRVPREEMPKLLQKFDVLVFPSIWDEPLARVMQEAMSTGLVVVGTLTGGTAELLVEGETGLTFAPGDAVMLAQRIEQLYKDPDLCRRLSLQGRNKVINEFSMHRMIDEIETNLTNILRETMHA